MAFFILLEKGTLSSHITIVRSSEPPKEESKVAQSSTAVSSKI